MSLRENAAEEVADGHPRLVFLTLHELLELLTLLRLLELTQAECHAALVRADVDDLDIDFLVRGEHVLGALAPSAGKLGVRYDALDAAVQANEGSKGHDARDGAVNDLADLVALGDILPGVGENLLQPQGDAVLLSVEAEDHHVDLLADLDGFAGVLDPRPRHLGYVKEAVDPPEVYEGAVVGDPPHDAAVDLVLFEGGEGLLAPPLTILFDGVLMGDDHPLPTPIHLNNLDLEGLPDEAVEGVDVSRSHVGGGQEAAQPKIDDESTLHPVGDHGAEHLALLVGIDDSAPDALVVGSLLGEHWVAFIVFRANDIYGDAVAHLQDLAVVGGGPVGELGHRDMPLGLGADVNQRAVIVHVDDKPFDDSTG